MSHNVKVSIERAGEDLKVTVAKAMQDADCENVILPGDSVLIKPNLSGCSIKGSTSIQVIKAIAQWAYDRGASKVVVGEGPVRMDRERLEKYFADIGIVEATKEVGASFVNFDDYEHVIHRNVSEHLPEEIGISKFVYEMDKIINVPMLKASINFIDSTKAMQGTDHNNGDVVDLKLVFCSKDIIAVDSVASYCIGIKPNSIRLIRLGKEEGIGESNLSNMEITGVSLEENRVKFELPEEAMSRRFLNLRILKKGDCSACTANFMDGLAFFVSERRTDTIVMGCDVPDRDDSVLIGDCTKEYWDDYSHVPGCPPTAMEIGRALSRNI